MIKEVCSWLGCHLGQMDRRGSLLYLYWWC